MLLRGILVAFAQVRLAADKAELERESESLATELQNAEGELNR